jgi:hypothetical protein
MDETFEQVDFSYSIEGVDEKFEIKTLEEIEYGDLIEQQESDDQSDEENNQTPVSVNPEPQSTLKDLLKEMISSGRIGDIEWDKAMEDPMTEEERKLYNEKYPPITDEEYREEIESLRRDRELGLTGEE